MDFLLIIVGLAGLWYGTELAIHGALSLSRTLGLSEFVVGVAVLSIGSDLPELTIAVDAGIRILAGDEVSDIVVGSAIGSSMGQIGLVLGIVGLIGYLTLPKFIIFQHGGVMLGSIVILALTGLDGIVTRTEGVVLLTVYSIYFVLLLTDKRNYEPVDEEQKQYSLSGAWMAVVAGLVFVIVGAELTVRSVTEIAIMLDVDDLIIAIVIVGVGTSLPELSISIGAIMKKRHSMSVGNLVGSNIFDTLVPVGAAAAISGLVFDRSMLRFDLPFLFVLSFVVLFFFVHKKGLQKSEALTVLAMYAVYVLLRLSRA